VNLTARIANAWRAFLYGYSYVVCAAISLLIGAGLGVLGVRWADRAPIDWPITATAIRDIATALGILGAGVWAAFLAERRRSLSTRAKLTHRHEVWKRDANKILRVYVTLRNIGDVQINPGRAGTYVQTPPIDAISSEGNAEDKWVDVKHVPHEMQEEGAYLEPGETEDYNFDFPIPPGCTLLQLHTYVECERRTDPLPGDPIPSEGMGKHDTDYNHWDLTTLVDLEKKPTGGDETSGLQPAHRRRFKGFGFGPNRRRSR
jgi:hypothetical protein